MRDTQVGADCSESDLTVGRQEDDAAGPNKVMIFLRALEYMRPKHSAQT